MTLINKLNNLLKNKFLRNVAMITSGTAFAQIIGIILLPILTRMYTPEDYGVLSVYTSVLLILGFFGSMNYELGIPIAKNDEKAISILYLSIIVLICLNVCLTFFMFLWGKEILGMLDGEFLVEYKYLIPVGLFFIGLYNILTQWAYRRKDYRSITKTKFTQAISQNLLSILIGVFGKGPVGLILGKIIGQSAGIYTLFTQLLKEDKSVLKKLEKKSIKWAAVRYIKFPLYTTPRRLLGDITIALPVIFMTSLYGPHAAGLFGLANSVVQMPMQLLGTSVSNVFYSESAALRHTDPAKIKELSNKLLKTLMLIGFIPVLVLALFGTFLFSLVFGDSWRVAGEYAGIISILVFTRLVFKPISNIFDIYEKQRSALILNIFRVVLVLIVFIVSSYFELSDYWFVGLYSVSMSIIYYVQYLLAQKILNDEIEKKTIL